MLITHSWANSVMPTHSIPLAGSHVVTSTLVTLWTTGGVALDVLRRSSNMAPATVGRGRMTPDMVMVCTRTGLGWWPPLCVYYVCVYWCVCVCVCIYVCVCVFVYVFVYACVFAWSLVWCHVVILNLTPPSSIQVWALPRDVVGGSMQWSRNHRQLLWHLLRGHVCGRGLVSTFNPSHFIVFMAHSHYLDYWGPIFSWRRSG